MAPPSRKKLKKAMLAIFMSPDEAEKKRRSKQFTKLLFSLVESRMKGNDEEEVYMKQMEAIGIFSRYIFRKNREKSEQGKAPGDALREIAEESDELFEEIEDSI